MPPLVLVSLLTTSIASLTRPLHAHDHGSPSAVAQSDDGMQCGNRLVTLGDTKADVFLKCGEPALRETPRVLGARAVIIVEEWTYNFGPGRFLRILTFQNSVLRSIKAGAYVQP